MSPTDRVVVVGHGPAAHRFVERLYHHGHDGAVSVLGGEDRPAYHRGLLTAVLAGPLPPAATALPALPGDADVRTGVRAVHVDRRRRRVVDDRGDEHPYDDLVLATGERTRDAGIAGLHPGRLPVGVRTMRTLDDAVGLPDGPVVVVGGGNRGTEVALTLARTGRPVDLVDPGPYPMHRHLDERTGELLAGALGEQGVTLHAGYRAVAYRPGALVLRGPAGNVPLPAPAVVLTTGSVPQAALAEAAGLGVSGVASQTLSVREPTSITERGGVVVDDRLRTADPRVSALGGVVGTRTLAAAWAQADVLARRLTGDDDARHVPPRALVRLRVGPVDVAAAGRAGDDSPEPDDVMTVADRAGTRYARLDLRDGRLVAASVIGFPRAAGALSRHWALDAPLPTARLALLLGTPATAGGGGPEELPDDAVICVCNTVTKGTLVEAWRGGAADVDAIATATLATTGCGTCAGTVRRLISTLEEQGADA